MTTPQTASFRLKLALAAGLIALADLLFYRERPGSTLGGFALALWGAVMLAHPASRRDACGRIGLATALVMALLLGEQPSFLELAAFWTALAVAVLAPKVADVLVAWRWIPRLFYLGAVGVIGPVLDLIELRRRWEGTLKPLAALGLMLILPVLGGGLFLGLFAAANPLISQTLAGLSLPQVDGGRALFWSASLVLVWTFLRPRMLGLAAAPSSGAVDVSSKSAALDLGAATIGLSLVVFNALFALQNGLDIAFLWRGAALPAGVSFSDYAHRGAFALIVAALLAGAFVLALRPGLASANGVWIRRLVVVWVGQTLVLVASSALRTLDYIGAYQLTGLRIAALLWMGLVAVGLVLVCWRMLRGKSADWLINANLLTAGLVLLSTCVVDLNAVAAAWNVREAREVNGQGAALDLCYLGQLGPSALVSLSELAKRPLPAELHDRVAAVRAWSLADLRRRQSAWRGWTWRGQRRLDRALAILPANSPAAAFRPGERACDGSLPQPASPSAPSPAATNPATAPS